MKEWRKGNYDSSHLLIRRPGQYTGTCPPAIVQSEKLMLGRGLPSRALEARAPARGPLEHSRAEGCAFECPWQRDTSAFWKPWLQLLPCETRPGGSNPVAIKSEAVRQSGPPGFPFPPVLYTGTSSQWSLLLCQQPVSLQTIHFWVLDKSLLSGLVKGTPSCNKKTLLREWKEKPQPGRKYWQITYLIKACMWNIQRIFKTQRMTINPIFKNGQKMWINTLLRKAYS